MLSNGLTLANKKALQLGSFLNEDGTGISYYGSIVASQSLHLQTIGPLQLQFKKRNL